MTTVNQTATVDQARLDLMNRYWNAANYLTIGQIYLKDNPACQLLGIATIGILLLQVCRGSAGDFEVPGRP